MTVWLGDVAGSQGRSSLAKRIQAIQANPLRPWLGCYLWIRDTGFSRSGSHESSLETAALC